MNRGFGLARAEGTNICLSAEDKVAAFLIQVIGHSAIVPTDSTDCRSHSQTIATKLTEFMCEL